ncbi:hypothetical protein D9C73_002047 [Collichthys lucidus]|uniref:Uncharacterized protein n=1 Tax=Collichthys lucidus TaxID=240159 RepID=A0A4U5U1N4_COLLU|nr:hypothetical protein D9C73_002047 [Collichthys lucidus]
MAGETKKHTQRKIILRGLLLKLPVKREMMPGLSRADPPLLLPGQLGEQTPSRQLDDQRPAGYRGCEASFLWRWRAGLSNGARMMDLTQTEFNEDAKTCSAASMDMMAEEQRVKRTLTEEAKKRKGEKESRRVEVVVVVVGEEMARRLSPIHNFSTSLYLELAI